MAEIEKIAADRYRIRAHDHVLTVDAQDLRDISDWALLHITELEREAAAAARIVAYNQEMDERNAINFANREKPWLPLHDGE